MVNITVNQWKCIININHIIFINISAKNDNFSDFSLLSYNVLAQNLIEKYPHFYDWSNESVLKWEYRSITLLDEIKQFNADVSMNSHLFSLWIF